MSLDYCNDPIYRRAILGQLNRGEGRHELARRVFHGNKGELPQPYREGEEEQLGALGLVLNCIVLYNTIYIQRALDQLAAEGYEIRREDVRRAIPARLRAHHSSQAATTSSSPTRSAVASTDR